MYVRKRIFIYFYALEAFDLLGQLSKNILSPKFIDWKFWNNYDY